MTTTCGARDFTGSLEIGVHDDLRKLRARLVQIHKDMSIYEPPTPKPPILDSSQLGDLSSELDDLETAAGGASTSSTESLPGLRALKETVKRDLEVLEKFLADPNCDSLPPLSTNAQYLIAVWNEVLAAPPSIVTISKIFPERDERAQSSRRPARGRGSSKSTGVKVDVVADDGRRWIRVNTIKNSRILAEFREIDSYLTDSDDDEADAFAPTLLPPSLSRATFDNSILRMGRSLISAAAVENKQRLAHDGPRSGSDVDLDSIKITLRLTRLDPHPQDSSQYDRRIPQTICELQEMGIDVQLGQLEPPPVQPPAPPRVLCPTMKVNLDLSILIALVSDLSHSRLPGCEKEAIARFVPPASYLEWKKKRKEGTTRAHADDANLGQANTADTTQHSRALVNQTLQEMDRGLLQEIHNQLVTSMKMSISVPDAPVLPMSSVEFWTTTEARARCLRIVSKIGGQSEKRRAHALLCSTPSTDYWRDSRFESDFIPIPPVHVFPPSDSPLLAPQEPAATLTSDLNSPSPFFQMLEATCIHILSHEVTLYPSMVASHLKSPSTSTTTPTHPIASSMESSLAVANNHLEGVKIDSDGDIDHIEVADGIHACAPQGEIQRATVTKANHKLTAHTVHSMLQGAQRGWTTLTANKASVKVILKELKALHSSPVGGSNYKNAPADDGAEKAVIWIVEPRSLAEGMRSDLVRNESVLSPF